jgi:hypothetical protein
MLTRTILPYVPDGLEARRHLAAMRADAELKANSLRHSGDSFANAAGCGGGEAGRETGVGQVERRL